MCKTKFWAKTYETAKRSIFIWKQLRVGSELLVLLVYKGKVKFIYIGSAPVGAGADPPAYLFIRDCNSQTMRRPRM